VLLRPTRSEARRETAILVRTHCRQKRKVAGTAMASISAWAGRKTSAASHPSSRPRDASRYLGPREKVQ